MYWEGSGTQRVEYNSDSKGARTRERLNFSGLDIEALIGIGIPSARG